MTLTFSQKSGIAPREILLCISVKDTGIGIKEENIAAMFDAFIRADMPSSRYIEGTGLGLAIAKELTELLGGQITVQSEWGLGSTFSVEIPQKIADAAPIQKSTQADETGVPKTQFTAPGASVLVVDDNSENLGVIRSLLSHTLMRVDTASSGAQSIEKAKTMRYDLILMDYMMPDMDGKETLHQLQKMPGFDTPVIALTANIIAGTKEKLLDAGFIEYLSKPLMLAVWKRRYFASCPLTLWPKATVSLSKHCRRKK